MGCLAMMFKEKTKSLSYENIWLPIGNPFSNPFFKARKAE